MPDDFVIKPFLLANKADVKHMILTEYMKKEIAEEQKEIGGLLKLAELVSDGTITLAKAAENAGMTVSEFKKRIAQLGKQTVGT